MALKAAKRQTLIMATKVAAEHASQRGELSAKLTKPQANKVMQAIGLSHGFSRVPYAFAVGELREVWAKEYAASPKRKAVTAQVKASVAKPKARTRRAAKPPAEAKVEVEATVAPTEPKADDDRVASLEAKLDKLAELVAALVTK